MRTQATISLLCLLVCSVACGGRGDASGNDAPAGDPAATASSAATASRPGAASGSSEDPCALLSRADVEGVIGGLRADPWGSGSTCHYEANDGQRLDVDAQYSGAQALAGVMGVVDDAISRGLIVPGARGLDTLEGAWDEAKWQIGNSLVARKGDRGVTIQMANVARPDPAAAARLADVAIGRLDRPLSYNGAAHAEPRPLVSAGDPCALLTREDVMRLAGPLAGTPVAEDGNYCRWPLAPRNGRPRDFSYTVTWTDGYADFNTKVGGLRLVQTNLEQPELARAGDGRGAAAVLAEMSKDPAGAKVLGAMKGLIKSGGAEVDDATLMPKSDPDVKGDWVRGALLAGEELLVVHKGVCIRARIQGVGYDAARALLGAMVARL